MKRPSHVLSAALLAVTLGVLLLSVPGSVRQGLDRGSFYVFSATFIEDLPKRLTGPGRSRFIFQPVFATILGAMNGIADARLGRPAYLFGVLFHRRLRRELLKTGLETIANLLLMGILLDSICQWLILGASYPGAALVVGPVLVAAPYSISRALANRFARRLGIK